MASEKLVVFYATAKKGPKRFHQSFSAQGTKMKSTHFEIVLKEKQLKKKEVKK